MTIDDLHGAITETRLRAGWTPVRIGRRLDLRSETVSTNTDALAAAEAPDADGLVVLAEYQTQGRGRLGRPWLSPRGAGVLCSALIIEPDGPPEEAFGTVAGRLTLVAGVAVCEAVRQATDIAPAIKWPNDLRAGGRKLGGVLIESRALPAGGRAWAIGVGINCLQHKGHFPPELQDSAGSLEMLTAQPVDRGEVARCLLVRLDAWLSGAAWLDDASVRDTWLSHAEPVGRRVIARCEGRQVEGTSLTIDPFGGLIVQGDDGRQHWLDPMRTTLL